MNKVEAEMVLCVYQQLMRHFPDLIKRPATAVITPYKAQVHFPHPVSLSPAHPPKCDMFTKHIFAQNTFQVSDLQRI